SIYWAADVFNLSDTTRRIFMERIVDSKNMRISIWGITQIVILYFVFSYISNTLKELLRSHFEKSDYSTAASKNVMARNILQVVVWGVWLLISLAIFHVNNTWLGYISVGFSTGVGFALKDIIENIYYGISLMAGRIKVGDWIEVDGKRGKVSSISYTSTQVDTIDGSIMAFQNSQLFTKNYKNLTKNHGYELAVIPIGVAYGTNANQVKEIIVNAITPLACRDQTKEVKVVFAEFGDNSINFKIIVWIPVLTQTYAKGEIMEAVYNALNENRIEIPYPQRDIHIITTSTPPGVDQQ
ncbi:MAG: mechanosensitive ion channel, partial [Prevotella sp.]|nr:mechanosensitive ion channel [Prevotella sp.]